MNDVFREFDTWEKFHQDQAVNNLWEPSFYPRESGMFKITAEL